MKTVTITLTEEEAKELASVLSHLEGCLQWRGVKTPSGELDDSWSFWHGITKKVTESFGFQGWLDPNTEHFTNLISKYRE